MLFDNIVMYQVTESPSFLLGQEALIHAYFITHLQHP
jgi:hypothetical protein